MSEITRILEAAQSGDQKAAHELLPLVYDELRRLAAAKMAREAPGQTVQATELVHEAWLKIAGTAQSGWQGRTHFFAAAAEAMRHLLIDRARRKRARRHGGGQHRVDMDELAIAAPAADEEMMAMHEALDKLAAVDSEKAELVKLKYFVGLTTEQAASALGISEATAKRHWAYARAWLYRAMQKSDQAL